MRKKPCSTCLIPVNHSNDSWDGIEHCCHCESSHCSLCWRKPKRTSTSGKMSRPHFGPLKFQSWTSATYMAVQFCSRPTIYTDRQAVAEGWKHTLDSFVGRDLAPDLFCWPSPFRTHGSFFPVRMPWSCTSWPSQIVHSQCWWMKRWATPSKN